MCTTNTINDDTAIRGFFWAHGGTAGTQAMPRFSSLPH